MASAAETRLHAYVRGRVQGVGFRHFVMTSAQSQGLDGWVRNLWDGRVEVLAEGSKDQLETLLNRLKRGPSSSYVADVEAEWLPATGEFTGFHVRFSS
jgi:acylphosphatase